MPTNSDGSIFRGVGPALITPFCGDGTKELSPPVDYGALKILVEMQIQGGVQFLVPCGTTGESPTLSHKEHKYVVKAVVDYAQGRVPVLAGTGSNYTAEAVELTQAAKDCGADGALVVAPYYNKPMPSGFLHYYRSIAEVGLPVILYDIPGRTAKGVPLEVILQLMKEGSIAGMKWASGNYDQIGEVIAHAPENFTVLSGDDSETFRLMQMGGHGVISVLSNLAPADMTNLIKAADEKDWGKAARLQEKLFPLMQAMFIETNPMPVKEALAMAQPGVFQPCFRSPMMPMEPASREKLRQILESCRLIDVCK